MPPVPVSPEPLAALKARFGKALEHVYGVRLLLENHGIRPGECAANVFDFEDGIRLIVSLEKVDDVFLHVSGSRIGGETTYLEVAEHFHLLSPDPAEFIRVQKTDRGVHHLVRKYHANKA